MDKYEIVKRLNLAEDQAEQYADTLLKWLVWVSSQQQVKTKLGYIF